MPYALLGLLLLVLVFAPQLWVRQVMTRHSLHRPDFPGTGGELARHLLDEAGLHEVSVETTPAGDHYDPVTRAVRLTPANHDGRSITAVAVAAHEVSHAVQHARGERLFDWRGRLMRLLVGADQIATIGFFVILALSIVTRSPFILLAQVALMVLLLVAHVAAHLVTLPLEIDASFGKALPVLERGRYLASADLPAARQVLRAAAFTYVAAALMSILNILRMMRFGR
ncbi:zinc metallopeptidase [Terrarubrum flagellatum]|uniref:zinc metallopeptidase n=1 Tax=Terrirubrum flagellatum TaxID=2895980 RepID=UPI00314543E8